MAVIVGSDPLSTVPLIGQLSNQLQEDLARLAELELILPVTLLKPDRSLSTAYDGG